MSTFTLFVILLFVICLSSAAARCADASVLRFSCALADAWRSTFAFRASNLFLFRLRRKRKKLFSLAESDWTETVKIGAFDLLLGRGRATDDASAATDAPNNVKKNYDSFNGEDFSMS